MNGTGRALQLPLIRVKRVLVSEEPEGVTAYTDFTDEQLLERIRKRDEYAALAVFHRYDRLAFSIGVRILQDEGEAEDLVQEIFLRLYAEAGTFDERKGSARTWIVQMFYRRAFDRRRYLDRQHFFDGKDLPEQANTVAEGKSLEDKIIERLTVRQLESAFSQLSDRQRATLEAFFFEGLTFAEIAARSGEEVKNVRHHYYRGLERLRHLVRQTILDRKNGR